MSHVFELSDEQYAALEANAHKQGQSPEEAFQAWVAAMTQQPGSRAKKGSRPQASAPKEPVAQPARASQPASGEAGGWDERRDEIFANNDLDDFANDE